MGGACLDKNEMPTSETRGVTVPQSFYHRDTYRQQLARVSQYRPPTPTRIAAEEMHGPHLPLQIKWTYGVTTVPSRVYNLLPQTLVSLEKAGFPSPRLFVDGAEAKDNRWAGFGLPVTLREKTTAYANWYLALLEMYLREPEADRYAIFQDDILLYRNLRGYLDQQPYPVPSPPLPSPQESNGLVHAPPSPGYWNLYTAPSNWLKCPNNGRFTGFYESNQCGKGALALVFSHEAVQVLLTAVHMVKRAVPIKVEDPSCKAGTRHTKSIDGAVVEAMRGAGWAEYVHAPSLVEHAGDVSTLGNDGLPKAVVFFGDHFDALQLSPSL